MTNLHRLPVALRGLDFVPRTISIRDRGERLASPAPFAAYSFNAAAGRVLPTCDHAADQACARLS